MSLKYILATFLVLIFTLVSAADVTENNKKAINALKDIGITIDFDKNINVIATSPVGDFMLLTFSTRKEILNAYIGNQPNFPGVKVYGTKSISSELDNSIKVVCYKWDKNSFNSGQCLVDFSKKIDFPQFVHFSYSNISKAEMKLVTKIIASVRLIDR